MIKCYHKTYKGFCGICGKEAPKPGRKALSVLGLIADGLTNDEIARALNCPIQTIRYHSGVLFKMFGVDNRTTLVVEAHRLRVWNLDLESDKLHNYKDS